MARSLIEESVRDQVAIAMGTYIEQTGDTIRTTAEIFGYSKSTVYVYVTERLKKVNLRLYYEVIASLKINKAERHIRGGNATREKYMEISKKKMTDKIAVELQRLLCLDRENIVRRLVVPNRTIKNLKDGIIEILGEKIIQNEDIMLVKCESEGLVLSHYLKYNMYHEFFESYIKGIDIADYIISCNKIYGEKVIRGIRITINNKHWVIIEKGV